MRLANSTIENIREYFKAKPVLKAWLFGSYVRGEADQSSDIDLLVDLDYSQKIGLKFVSMKLDLEKLLVVKVDLISSAAVSKHIRTNIEAEKILIYAR